MATKQTANRAAKQAKRNKSAKLRNKKATVQQATIKSTQKKAEQQKRLMQDIAAKGPVEAARKLYKKGKGKNSTAKLTNKTVIENINLTIVATIKNHSGVEIFTRLAEEKKFVIQPVEQELINLLDEQIVKMCENIDVMSQFIMDDKDPEEYMEIFVDYTHLVAQLTEETFPAIIDMLIPKGELIDQYAEEHVNGRERFAYMESLHNERMAKVIELYATRIGTVELAAPPVHAYTPDNQQPSDPLIDDDVAEAELVIEPDLEKDVESANQ